MKDKANVAYVYNGILLSHKKRGILPSVITWMNLEGFVLSKINQTGQKWGKGTKRFKLTVLK